MGVLVASEEITPNAIAGAASLILSDGERERELIGTRPLHGIYVLPGLKIPTPVKEKTWAESASSEGRRPTSARAKNAEGGVIPMRIVAPSGGEIIHEDPEDVDAFYGNSQDIGERFHYLLDDLQELVQSADEKATEGNGEATLRYTAPDGRQITYRLASIQLVDWPQDRMLAHYRAEPSIEFEYLPWGELPAVTVAEGTIEGPIGYLDLDPIPGHVNALITATFADLSDTWRDDIEIGVQEHYDPDEPEPLRILAENLEVLAGTLDVDNIEASTVPHWVAIAGTGELPHKGRWRVSALVDAQAGVQNVVETRVRFQYRSGDGELRMTNRQAVTPHAAGKLIEIDLGIVNILEVSGNHAWSGQVEIFAPSPGLVFKLRALQFMPAERSARLRAPATLGAALELEAYDTFVQDDGPLDGEAAPGGEVWDKLVGSGDFQIVGGHLERDDEDDQIMSRLGTGEGGFIEMRVDVNLPPHTPGDFNFFASRAGLFVRLTPAGDFLSLVRDHWSWGLDRPVTTDIVLAKHVGGVVTLLAEHRVSLGAHLTGWYTLGVVLNNENGGVGVFTQPQGQAPKLVAGVASDPDLAVGGALEEGGFGIRDFSNVNGAGTRMFDNVLVSLPAEPVVNHVIFPGRELRVDHRKAERENADGTRWGEVKPYRGRRLVTAPGTRAGRRSRLVVRQDVNDLDRLIVGDDGHQLDATIQVTPRVSLV